MLSETDIQEFQVMYQKHFGVLLDKDETQRMSEELIRLVRLVYERNTESPKKHI